MGIGAPCTEPKRCANEAKTRSFPSMTRGAEQGREAEGMGSPVNSFFLLNVNIIYLNIIGSAFLSQVGLLEDLQGIQAGSPNFQLWFQLDDIAIFAKPFLIWSQSCRST